MSRLAYCKKHAPLILVLTCLNYLYLDSLGVASPLFANMSLDFSPTSAASEYQRSPFISVFYLLVWLVDLLLLLAILAGKARSILTRALLGFLILVPGVELAYAHSKYFSEMFTANDVLLVGVNFGLMGGLFFAWSYWRLFEQVKSVPQRAGEAG